MRRFTDMTEDERAQLLTALRNVRKVEPMATPQRAAKAGSSRQPPPWRAGKRGVTFYLDQAAWKTMQIRVITEDTTVQEFIERIVMTALR